ncbi:MAG: TRAP transporter small permease subunit [Bacteroidia bacterium]|nr:TRAP transporter small permease subunit [Bacteroidia bacterium]MDW8236117.1 TRAP transporter small permease subunit [Bacteroidia bacterium]
MSSFIRGYLRWQERIHRVEKTIAALLMLFISAVVLAGVFSRYLLKEPFYGTDRLATYLFVILSYWGLQMASGYYEHITVGVVRQWLSPSQQALLSSVASLISAAFLSFLGWGGYKFVRLLYKNNEIDLVLQIPLWVVYGFFVLAVSLSAVRYAIGSYLWIEVWRGRVLPEAFQRKAVL